MSVPETLVYSGSMKLTDPTAVPGVNAGRLVLSPTRTYAPVIRKVLETMRPADTRHGALLRRRADQDPCISLTGCTSSRTTSSLCLRCLISFRRAHRTPWEEMYRVFNMGHRMELYVHEADAAGNH
ncbi:MAG: hypothetical protein MZV63_52650 [Marinilabiliales bacterium]|nr:hypothetical protein [Marinilabiliales bacterium]